MVNSEYNPIRDVPTQNFKNIGDVNLESELGVTAEDVILAEKFEEVVQQDMSKPVRQFEGMHESLVPIAKGLSQLSKAWTNLKQDVGARISQMGIGGMLNRVTSSISNFQAPKAQAQGSAAVRSEAKFESVKSEGEKSEIEEEHSTDFNALDLLKLAKSDPKAAGQFKVTTQQWIALAKEDPETTGRLLFDQTNPPKDNLTQPPMIGYKESPQIIKAFSDNLSHKELAKVISGAFSGDIQREENPNKLNREEPIGILLLKEFIKQHINPIVGQSEEMKALMKSIPDKELITGPKGLQEKTEGSDEFVEKFLEEFLNVASRLLVDDKSEQMASFKEIASQFKNEGNSRWEGENAGAKGAASLVFLRFLNPILTTPNPIERGVDFKYENRQQQNNALFLSKVMQNMANQTQSKEDFMVPFNEISNKMRPDMDALMDKITG